MNEVTIDRNALQQAVNLLSSYKQYLARDTRSSAVYTYDAIDDVMVRLAKAITS